MDAAERRKRIETEATEWWLILQGQPSRVEREQYVDWLRESSAHVAGMLRIAQLHGLLEQFEGWGGLPPEGSGEPEGAIVPLPAAQMDDVSRQTMRAMPPWTFRALWLTAVLAVVTMLGTIIVLNSRGEIIRTDRGERRDLALADGSVVDLAPETRVRVKYEKAARYIFLERGRALFHVSKNPNRPFWVQADDTRVRAVGTAFAVDREPHSVVVTVAEGTVAVFPARPASVHPVPIRNVRAQRGLAPLPQSRPEIGVASTPEAPGSASGHLPAGSGRLMQAIFLTADEQLTVNGSGAAEPIREVDSNRALAWAAGRLIFDHESIEDAVREFNRYNRIQLRIDDPDLARKPISGVFDASDPASFVAFLETVTAVRVTRDDAGNITMLKPENPK